MDHTTNAISHLEQALQDASPDSRVTVMVADLRAALSELGTLRKAYATAEGLIGRLSATNILLEEQIETLNERY